MARTKAVDLVGTEIKGFKILDWKRENKRTYLLAVCPFCSKRKWMRKDQIDNPKVVSCGCYNAKNNYIKNKDITGQTFGRLTAVRPTDRKTPAALLFGNASALAETQHMSVYPSLFLVELIAAVA